MRKLMLEGLQRYGERGNVVLRKNERMTNDPGLDNSLRPSMRRLGEWIKYSSAATGDTKIEVEMEGRGRDIEKDNDDEETNRNEQWRE